MRGLKVERHAAGEQGAGRRVRSLPGRAYELGLVLCILVDARPNERARIEVESEVFGGSELEADATLPAEVIVVVRGGFVPREIVHYVSPRPSEAREQVHLCA